MGLPEGISSVFLHGLLLRTLHPLAYMYKLYIFPHLILLGSWFTLKSDSYLKYFKKLIWHEQKLGSTICPTLRSSSEITYFTASPNDKAELQALGCSSLHAYFRRLFLTCAALMFEGIWDHHCTHGQCQLAPAWSHLNLPTLYLYYSNKPSVYRPSIRPCTMQTTGL
jgi:hypothetical protein